MKNILTTVVSINICLISLQPLKATNSDKVPTLDNLKVSNDTIPGDTLVPENSLKTVELFTFEAIVYENEVKLSWTTITEINNDYFLIERSMDAFHWEAIGQVEGTGTSSLAIEYDYIDIQPQTGIIYYRLKQLDFNGEYIYSPIEAVDFNYNSSDICVFPLPASNYVQVSFEEKQEENVVISIYGPKGKMIENTNCNSKVISIDISELLPGIYIILIERSGSLEVRKLIKK